MTSELVLPAKVYCNIHQIIQYNYFNEGNNKVPELVAAQETDEIQLNQTGSKNYAGL